MAINSGRAMRPLLAPSTSITISFSSASDSPGSTAASSSSSSSPLLSASISANNASTIPRQSARFCTVSQLSSDASRSSNFMSGHVRLAASSLELRNSAAHSSGSASSWLAIPHTSASVRWLPPSATSARRPSRNCAKLTESSVPPSLSNSSRRRITCGSPEFEIFAANCRSSAFLSTLKVPNICRRRTTSELSVSSCFALASPPSRTHGFCSACTAVGRLRGSLSSRLRTNSLAPSLTSCQSPLVRSSGSEVIFRKMDSGSKLLKSSSA
mmetsp:Transcript_34737/g.61940  ORF Transcript_34737/g.61940 Transcript_34737/m.61940 type:complete len:270 (-) Transcript_34737:585-1394(-)